MCGNVSAESNIIKTIEKSINKKFLGLEVSEQNGSAIYYYDKDFYIYVGGTSVKITGTVYGCGSGGDYAVGAYVASGDIDKAMIIASKLCTYTSPEFDVVKLK